MFDAASADRPGAANRAFEAVCATRGNGASLARMFPMPANITPNPRRPVARYLDEEEFQRMAGLLSFAAVRLSEW